MRRVTFSTLMVAAAAAAALIGASQSVSAAPKLPPIKHVFTIVLENKD